MHDKFQPQHTIFFRKGTADLKLSSYAFSIEDDALDMEIVFFHLQQAAEKFLKTLLSFNNVHFEKIHDIRRLIDLCAANSISLPDYVEEFVALNPFAVEGRYATITDDTGDAQHYLTLLDQFKLFVAGRATQSLGSAAIPPPPPEDE